MSLDFRPSTSPTIVAFVRPLHKFNVKQFLNDRAIHPVTTELTRRKNGMFITFESVEKCQAFCAMISSEYPDILINYSEPRTPILPEIPMAVNPKTAALPPGLMYYPDFITKEEEAHIVSSLDQRHWLDQLHRRVQHFGLAFDYSTKHVGDVQQPFPAWADSLVLKINSHLSRHLQLNQLTCNEYLPGVGISRHVDTHSAFSDIIPVVSLIDPIAFDLFKGTDEFTSLWIQPRSLLVMTGEVRYGWLHAIARRKVDVDPLGDRIPRSRRISLTFRETTMTPCECIYPDMCDSRVPMLMPSRLPV